MLESWHHPKWEERCVTGDSEKPQHLWGWDGNKDSEENSLASVPLQTDSATVLLGIILLPFRAICIALILLLTWPIAAVVTFCHPERGSVPLTGWKRKVIQCAFQCLGRALFFLMGFQIKVKGKVAGPLEAPIFVAAPHSSFFDGIVGVVAGFPSSVSRLENLSTPVFGTIIRSFQPILVSRLDPDSRRNTINEITKRATSGGQWPQVLIFPEGTCTNRSCLITFKQGCTDPFLHCEFPSKAECLSRPSLPSFLGGYKQHNCPQLSYHPALPEQAPFKVKVLQRKYIKNNKRIYTHANTLTRDHLSSSKGSGRALNLPVTDHTFEDCRLMISAGQLTLSMEAGLVEFTKISKKLNLKWDPIRDQLDTFAAIANASKGGRIGVEEFAEHLKLPVSDALKELFLLFDRNGDGTIDFREYVIGLSVLCNPANTEETIQMAFKLFDIDDDGSITEEEFACILRSSLGVPDLDVSQLFKEIDTNNSGRVTYNEFKHFAFKHPEYAKLFTTYLDLQRCQLQTSDEEDDYQTPGDTFSQSKTSVSEKTPIARNKVCPDGNEEDLSSTSDKKDD
ncbi:Lysophosphatidylcholine acyltransferase 2 [Chelonia mydas]|uniref:Lysophosphatidylcholine acyltransferase 2 n=1 Tax=Chelonia mydas TaxID=8469 RepID=M7CJQ0_CHEMY|nr:Lysophosphatidylcholine acyltransferase 2 [Chelonia mydas]